ncbi:hypothetical protein Btru_057261 [Bulinus truncatus]|nr:hypothetical protein Btru_057261 [Bulinus truncatus]
MFGNSVIDRAFTGRRKREVLDCNKSFYCPSDLTNIFIYPDWSNTACDSYVVCFRGTLLVSSCKTDGYKYYNPRRLSCEEVSSQSNTCLYRLNTDLSPLF